MAKVRAGNKALEAAFNYIFARLDAVEEGKPFDIRGKGLQLTDGPDGLVLESKHASGGDSFLEGFLVKSKGLKKGSMTVIEVTVSPSIVTGLPSNYMPTLGGAQLDAAEAPRLEVKGGDYVYLRVEIQPSTQTIQVLTTDENGDETTVSRKILGSGGTVVGEITVEKDNSGEQPAEITEAGNKINGIFYVPLAYITPTLSVRQLSYGPQMWDYIGYVGALAVYPPVIVHTGNIITVLDD